MDGPAYGESSDGDHIVEAMTLDSTLAEHFSGLDLEADVEDAKHKEAYATIAGGFKEGPELASGEKVCRGRDRLEVSTFNFVLNSPILEPLVYLPFHLSFNVYANYCLTVVRYFNSLLPMITCPIGCAWGILISVCPIRTFSRHFSV